MNLNELGWSGFFDAQMERWRDSGLVPGRVVGDFGQQYAVVTGKGRFAAQVSGHFQYVVAGRADYPAVGDWVLARGDGDPMIVEKVLERKSYFSRQASGRRCDEQVIAANIDTMFVVASLDGGRNFTPRGIERYIVMVREGGAEPVLVLNKCDLCGERGEYLAAAQSVAPGIPVVVVSALTGEGMDGVRALLAEGATGAFTGPSGAGKSSLINALLGDGTLRTGALREHDMRGRHTTTGSELVMLPSGGMVIDTAGLRELRPFGEKASLDSAFPEIAEAATGCRYSDCGHTDEPGCAVLAMVEDGSIEFERYQNYVSIRKEMDVLEAMKSEKGRMERKARDKKLSKLVKEFNRDFRH